MVIKQYVVDVLMVIYERYLGDENEFPAELDEMHDHLEQIGFERKKIKQAFDWLEDLAINQEEQFIVPATENCFRVYSDKEKEILNIECIGFMSYLEQTDIITPCTRELILDRVFALNHPLDIDQLKWIVMIVLHGQPGEENASAWMESLVFDEIVDYIQ